MLWFRNTLIAVFFAAALILLNVESATNVFGGFLFFAQPILVLVLAVKSFRSPIESARMRYRYLCVATVLAVLIAYQIFFQQRRDSRDQGQILVNAVESYQLKHGRLPTALSDLVPDYISHVPQTRMGLLFRSEYSYGVSKRDETNFGIGFESSLFGHWVYRSDMKAWRSIDYTLIPLP